MRQILKSYLKLYFKNWIEAWGLIIFIIIIVATISGILSGALQYKIKYNDLVYVSKKWDYDFNMDYYKNNFLEDYYLNNKFIDKNKNEINVTGFNQSILNKKSDWWKKTKIICNNNENLELEKNCLTNQIIDKLTEFDQYNEIKENINGINQIAYFYFKKNKNWNQHKEIVSRLLKQKKNIKYSVGVFETILLKQENKSNYLLKIVPAVVKNLENTSFINFNKLKLYKGKMPIKDNEVVINSLFAEQNNLKINNIFSVIKNNPKFDLKIVGIGNNLNNFVRYTNLNINYNNIEKYGVLFTTDEFQIKLKNANIRGELGFVDLKQNQKTLIKLNSKKEILTLKENLAQGYINPTATLTPYENNYISIQTQNINIQIILYITIGSILLFLGFIFINFNMKKDIYKTCKQIGIFKAFGYKKSELSWISSTKFFITIFLGTIFGYCISIPIQLYVNVLYSNGLLITFKSIYVVWWFMLILFLIIPVFFTILSFLFTINYLKKPSLFLINGEEKIKFYNLIIKIKKIFSKTNFLFRIQLAFTLKGFLKWITVMFIFFISSLLFIIQFNASDIFNKIIYSINNIYQNDVDHYFKFPNILTISTNDINEKEKLKLINDNNFRILPTNNIEQTQNVSLTKFNKLANEIHKNPIDANLWKKLFFYKPIYQSVYLNDLIQVIKDLINITNENLPNWGKKIINLSNLIDYTKIKTVVSFNTLYYNPKTELPVINLDVTPSNNEMSVINNVILKGIEPKTWEKFYKIKNINSNIIKKLFDFPLTRTKIPAIISEKISKLNNLKINDVFEFTVKNSKTSYNLSINVIGINKEDTIQNNIFINANNIRFLFYDFKGNKILNNFYNGIISKEKIIYNKINPKKILLGKQNIKIALQNLTINIFNNNIDNNLGEILNTLNNNSRDISIFTGNDNVDLISLQKLLAKSGFEMLNNSLLILQILNIIIIIIILTVIVFSIIDKANQVILTMRSLGYKPNHINFIIIGNYVTGVLIIFFISYITSLFIWYFTINIILYKFKFIINLPLNWQTPLKVGIIIINILLISWLLSIHLIKKQNINELTQQN